MQHPDLASGRWQALSLVEQMANVGSEVVRALNWQSKGNREYSRMEIKNLFLFQESENHDR